MSNRNAILTRYARLSLRTDITSFAFFALRAFFSGVSFGSFRAYTGILIKIGLGVIRPPVAVLDHGLINSGFQSVGKMLLDENTGGNHFIHPSFVSRRRLVHRLCWQRVFHKCRPYTGLDQSVTGVVAQLAPSAVAGVGGVRLCDHPDNGSAVSLDMDGVWSLDSGPLENQLHRAVAIFRLPVGDVKNDLPGFVFHVAAKMQRFAFICHNLIHIIL